MGAGISRRPEPEVHVVVVQAQESGKVDARVVKRITYNDLDPEIDTAAKKNQDNIVSHQTPKQTMAHTHANGYRPTQAYSDISSPIPTPSRMPSKDDNYKLRFQRINPVSSRVNIQVENISDTTYHPSTDFGNNHEERVVNVGRDKRQSEDLSREAGRTTTFELFRTYDGDEYTVYMRDDGKRFYVDFEEQKWRYFPESWEKRGYFLPIDYDPYENPSDSKFGKQFVESRSGEFIHPTKGKLVTYLRQEMQNVLYYLDEASGSWLPMPLSWERHVPNVTSIIEKVQRACPDWKDVRGIVALLRQCNYNVEDCVSTYILFNDDGVLDISESSGRDILKAKAEKKLADTMARLNEVLERNRELETQNDAMQNKLEELEMENQRIKREIERKLQDQKRVSKVYQKHSTVFRPHIINPIAVQPLLRILREDTRALRAKVLSLRNTTAKGFKSYISKFDQLSSAISQLLRIHRGQISEINEVRTLYQNEALQRKLLYNKVQELKGNIRVFCRCRFDGSAKCALEFDASGMVVCSTAQGRKKTYDFEKLFPPDTTQEEVFQDTKPIITSCVDGYNVCIIAYGQTGAGKTYTMMGTPENPGVNIRSMKELFKICKERPKVKFTMRVSIVEVYNEAVYDLLVPPTEGHEKLQIVKKGKETVVQGLTEIEVRNMNDILMIMHEGEHNRTVADTKMNKNSSRSHQVLMLRVEGYDCVSKTTSHGRLTLVDLAGSERISRSEATGIRLVEAAAINKSLSALGQVFSSIRSSALHIPYRNSKLTFLLQPSIGGDSKVCIFVNISPLSANMAETISTLEFGHNVRQVELGQAHRHITKHI